MTQRDEDKTPVIELLQRLSDSDVPPQSQQPPTLPTRMSYTHTQERLKFKVIYLCVGTNFTHTDHVYHMLYLPPNTGERAPALTPAS